MAIIICLRVDARNAERHVLPDTEKTPCSVCGDELFISKSGRDAVEKYGHLPTCEQCAAADPEFSPDESVIHILPEQMEELQEAGVTETELAMAKRIADRRLRSFRNSQFGGGL